MIISKAPYRICIAGGGSDLPEFYENNGGKWISASIDKYITTVIHQGYTDRLILKYSNKIEKVSSIDEVEHPIIKEILFEMSPIPNGTEIVFFSDLQSSSGMGSSGAFSVSLIAALSDFLSRDMDIYEIAEMAYRIERDNLGRKCGKQDPYASVYGGMNLFECDELGIVSAQELSSSFLKNSLFLIPSGILRSSSKVIQNYDMSHIRNKMEAVNETLDLIASENINLFACHVNHDWELKRGSKGVTNDMIDDKIKKIRYIAKAAKISGAGGGGYILAVVDPKDAHEFLEANRDAIQIKIGREGVKTWKL